MKISVTNLKNIFKKVIGSENESVSSEEPKSEQVQQIEKVQAEGRKGAGKSGTARKSHKRQPA